MNEEEKETNKEIKDDENYALFFSINFLHLRMKIVSLSLSFSMVLFS